MKAIHKKTGKIYKIITDNFMFKQDGVWIKNLVLYEALYPNPDGKYFARTKKDFNEHFEMENESEDERIRKKFIKLVKMSSEVGGFALHKWEADEMLAWLEKQDESDETKAKMFLISKGYPIDANGIFPTYEEMYNIIREGLEHQGYSFEKPIDKVESKFKVGDWITFNENHNGIYQVERIDNYRYYLRHYLGGTLSVHFDNELIRPWTIQDAKPGDVLATDKSVFIYAKVLYNQPHAYCGVDKFGVFKDNCLKNNWTTSVDKVHPATKEQREVLFYKTREAGYKWNKTKKELKKIEKQEPKTKMD